MDICYYYITLMRYSYCNYYNFHYHYYKLLLQLFLLSLLLLLYLLQYIYIYIIIIKGGWSIHWQGAHSDDEFATGVTIKQAFEKPALFKGNVRYMYCCDSLIYSF